MINRFSALKGIILSTGLYGAAASLPSVAFANGDSMTCPPEWAEYVATVAEIIAPLGEDFPLLFVSRKGDVFDCLGRIRDEAFLEKASALERTLPIDRASALSVDPASWPTNICSSGLANWRGMAPYESINLPLEREILETDACRVRITRLAEIILSENKND